VAFSMHASIRHIRPGVLHDTNAIPWEVYGEAYRKLTDSMVPMYADRNFYQQYAQPQHMRAFAVHYFGGLPAACAACQQLQKEPWALAPSGEFGLLDAHCTACNVCPAIMLFQVGRLGGGSIAGNQHVAIGHCRESLSWRGIPASQTVAHCCHAIAMQDLNDLQQTDDVPEVYCALCAIRLKPRVKARLLMAPRAFQAMCDAVFDPGVPVAVSICAQSASSSRPVQRCLKGSEIVAFLWAADLERVCGRQTGHTGLL
jgi:hypothetical protein